MNSILNMIFAWLSLVMIIMLCALFPLSKQIKKKKYADNEKLIKLRNLLKQCHKPFGMIVIIVMFLHGKFVGQKPGIEAMMILLLSLLIALSYLLHKQLKSWKLLHLSLSIMLISMIIIHLFIVLFLKVESLGFHFSLFHTCFIN